MAAVAAALAWLSHDRSANVWNTERALWSEACRRSPGKARPKLQLARVSKIADAKRLLAEAAAIEPRNADISNELGLLLLRDENPAEALGAFGKALAMAPNDANIMNNRGVALYQLGQREAARQDFLRALQMDPCLADARKNLAETGTEAPDAVPPRPQHCPD
jgi:Flp pilus assembly protein TadD